MKYFLAFMNLNQFYLDSTNGCIVCTGLSTLLEALLGEHLYWADFWMIDVETYLISWGTCSCLLSVALIKCSDQEQLGEDKLIYFSLHFQ